MENAVEIPAKQEQTKPGVWADTRGDTGFVEWLLLVGLIAIAGFVAFQTIGKNVSTKADEAGQKILDVKFDGTP